MVYSVQYSTIEYTVYSVHYSTIKYTVYTVQYSTIEYTVYTSDRPGRAGRRPWQLEQSVWLNIGRRVEASQQLH